MMFAEVVTVPPCCSAHTHTQHLSKPTKYKYARAAATLQHGGPHSPTCPRQLFLHEQSASEVDAILGVLTPTAHFVQLPSVPTPAFHSPCGHGAT